MMFKKFIQKVKINKICYEHYLVFSPIGVLSICLVSIFMFCELLPCEHLSAHHTFHNNYRPDTLKVWVLRDPRSMEVDSLSDVSNIIMFSVFEIHTVN